MPNSLPQTPSPLPAIHPRIILVRSLYEANIGAASRAMANMGLIDLILIAPACEFTEVSQKAAATGQHALQNRRVYPDWESYYAAEPQGLRVAFTARDRHGFDTKNFSDVIAHLIAEAPQLNHVTPSASTDCSPDAVVHLDLIFGPEHWGLANADVDQAHFTARIPTYGDNTSLNLAQAVLIGMFMLRQSPLGSSIVQLAQLAELPKAAPEALAPPLDDDLIRRWITSLGFDLDDRRASVFTVVRRLFQHAVPTVSERQSLNVILQQSIRKMREYQGMRKQLGLEKETGGKGLPYVSE